MSRYPVDRVTVIGSHSGQPEWSVVRYDVRTPGGVVAVFGVHLMSPRDALWSASRGKPGGPEKVTGNSELRRV